VTSAELQPNNTMVNTTEMNEGTAGKPAKTATKRRTAAKPATARNTGDLGARKKAAPRKKKTATASVPTQEDIALRAYLIGERRQQAGLPGDSTSDWLQAERELLG
jgi:hypothetical protein